MQAAAPVSSTPTCSFKSLSQLATRYFNAADAKVVRGIITKMQDSGAFSPTDKNGGFDVMTYIAANVKAGNTDVADASSLTNGLLACMYNRSNADSLALPGSFPEDFTVAANPATFGAYEVRGGATADPVLSRSVPPLSGVAPDATTWGVTLSGNSPQRALLYGAPGLLFPNTYEWRVVPRNATFSPAVIVGVCIDVNSDPKSLLHEEHVGLLPLEDATFLAGGCPSFGARPWSTEFASRIMHWGMDLLGPRPLSATTAVNPGGLAGSTGSLRSLFGPEHVDTVALTFVVQPKDVQVGAIMDSVVVQATNKFTGSTVANVTIVMTALNNNGTPADLLGDTLHVTDYAGLATFKNLSNTKTGGYLLVASGKIENRTSIFVLQGTSTRFNVRP